jgi:hypothetical protein
MPEREKLFSTSNPAGAGCNSGRARVPARREQVYVINLVKRWIRSVLGFDKTDREDAIPPGCRSGCVTSTKNEAPCEYPPI